MNRHLQEAQNKYDSHTNTAILSRRLCVRFICCLCLFGLSFSVNSATIKTVNCEEWFESFESFLSTVSIFLNLWIWMSMNQTNFEGYEFDVNVGLIPIATCTYKSMLNCVRMNQSSWISKLLKKRLIAVLWFALIIPQV